MPEIILFDIDNKDHLCWSPNTVKPRYVLALKGLDYRTEWVSYPDIDSRLRQHGQQDAEKVTCPVLLYDGQYIPESFEIAKFLEEKHPEPTIFPAGLEATTQFAKYCTDELKRFVFAYILAQVPPILDDRGAEYFSSTRTKAFGKSLEEISAPGDDHFLPKLRGGFSPVFHALRQSDRFIHGNQFGYGDAEVLSLLQWVLQVDKSKFDKIMALDGDNILKSWWDRCGPYRSKMD